MTSDLNAFVDALKFTGFFDEGATVVVARAPGRLDVMGGIADYSGSLVLQRTISEATFAALQRTDALLINVVSLSPDPDGIPRVFALPLSSLCRDGAVIGYNAARMIFQNAEDRWAAYVVGAFVVLMAERGAAFPQGCRILISSRVPEGKGVASSAALEVAVMQAVATAFEMKIPPKEMALLCQMVENLVAGAPCGVMDQMASVCGESHSLLALVCQPAELLPPLPVPEGIAFWGLDSGERHAVSGSDYTLVRTAAFMGQRMIRSNVNGYLASLSPADFEREFVSILPERMSGAEFLARYSGTADTVTSVDAGCIYPVRQATKHPIFENYRVQEFRRLLLAPASEQQWIRLGELMVQSHDSYSACGLASRGTDLIASLVREAGPGKGLYGARITGGGSGGTVAILGRADAHGAIAEVAEKYMARTGYSPHVFSGSSPGAAQFGSRILMI